MDSFWCMPVFSVPGSHGRACRHIPLKFLFYIQVHLQYFNSAHLQIPGEWKVHRLSNLYASDRVTELPWWPQAGMTRLCVGKESKEQFLQRRFWAEIPMGLFHFLYVSSSKSWSYPRFVLSQIWYSKSLVAILSRVCSLSLYFTNDIDCSGRRVLKR